MNRSPYYLELKHAMEKRKMVNDDMACSVLGLSSTSFSMRMNCKRPFTAGEIALMGEELNIPHEKYYDYFIAPFYEVAKER